MVKINSIRFGEIEVADDKVIEMPGGILGFPNTEKYVLLDHDDEAAPFKWLQSVEQPELAFVVTDPLAFFPDYNIQVKKEELAALHIDDAKDVVILVILSLRGEPKDMTANLQGPIVVNSKNMTGRQVVLREGRYTTKHTLFPDMREAR